ncbi:STAS domain-containing protein [Cesiribacter andamanensis]|uniref:Anti-sigma factor antagonist n=1 Tax=Cesiribacter andamanensis AMV16 TaxID=1279009 RepID=M7NAM4_9BACT|nr:STAS domain-containing protein [Cesiribacter andamanensis]EMR04297.1 Anti-anti-sigma-B factor [Cesiribacter andamanensis AMV16]
MKYSIDKQERYSLVILHEEKLDTTLAPKLKSELITLHAEGVKNIVLDVSEVKYIDSSGLSSLLVGNRILTEDGGIFVIASPTEHVQKLIKISQLDNVLSILPSREEAIDAVFMNEIENDLNSGDNLN